MPKVGFTDVFSTSRRKERIYATQAPISVIADVITAWGVGRKAYYYRNLDIYQGDKWRELQQYFLQSVLINDNKVPRDWFYRSICRKNQPQSLTKTGSHDATGTVIDDWKAKYGASLNGFKWSDQTVMRARF
uniref:Uncharacterized protein n=1 Tax=Salmonella sp. TaxID=599 RepID=A0A482EWY8_SALSP|nr:hypothetical protein [Salmonella sp.]QBM91345.1 hypothetical protein NNIBIDOC_00012 [Salmonella sp.]